MKQPNRILIHRLLKSDVKYPLGATILILLIWQWLCPFWIESYFLPTPKQIALAVVEFKSELWMGLKQTLMATTQGLGIAVLSGFGIGMLFHFSVLLRKSLMPFAIFLQTVPIVTIAPLLVIWFGFGTKTVVACSAIVSVFPMLVNTATGLSKSDQELVELLRFYKSSAWQLFWKVELPQSLPYLLAGLRISIGLAVIGAIIGEFVAGGGLGGVIDGARNQQRTDLVFAAVVMSSLIGLVLISVVNLMQKALLNWRPFFNDHSA